MEGDVLLVDTDSGKVSSGALRMGFCSWKTLRRKEQETEKEMEKEM